MNVAPGAIYEAVIADEPGLVGDIGMLVTDNAGGTTTAFSTAAIVETPAGSGVYAATRTGPSPMGQYTIVWKLNSTGETLGIEELVVTRAPAEVSNPVGIDLCTIDDVKSYVPGYASDDETDALLARLITSESEQVMTETGREIVPFAAQPQTRSFEIDETSSRTRQIEIGDLSGVEDSDFVVELLDSSEANPVTVDPSGCRPLYRLKRQPREQWEPVTRLEFLAAAGAVRPGRTVLVTGNWGFPAVPTFIREATAKRVILRYVTDVAASGTAFSDAIDNLNLAGLFASARDAVAQLNQGAMIR
jgi:hypothetical protein